MCYKAVPARAPSAPAVAADGRAGQQTHIEADARVGADPHHVATRHHPGGRYGPV